MTDEDSYLRAGGGRRRSNEANKPPLWADDVITIAPVEVSNQQLSERDVADYMRGHKLDHLRNRIEPRGGEIYVINNVNMKVKDDNRLLRDMDGLCWRDKSTGSRNQTKDITMHRYFYQPETGVYTHEFSKTVYVRHSTNQAVVQYLGNSNICAPNPDYTYAPDIELPRPTQDLDFSQLRGDRDKIEQLRSTYNPITTDNTETMSMDLGKPSSHNILLPCNLFT